MTVGGPAFEVVTGAMLLPAFEAGCHQRSRDGGEDGHDRGGDAAHVRSFLGFRTADADASRLQIGRSREKLKGQ